MLLSTIYIRRDSYNENHERGNCEQQHNGESHKADAESLFVVDARAVVVYQLLLGVHLDL